MATRPFLTSWASFECCSPSLGIPAVLSFAESDWSRQLWTRCFVAALDRLIDAFCAGLTSADTLTNTFSFDSASLRLSFMLPMTAFFVGLVGPLSCNANPCACAQFRITGLFNSAPLSLAVMIGSPSRSTRPSSSVTARATRYLLSNQHRLFLALVGDVGNAEPARRPACVRVNVHRPCIARSNINLQHLWADTDPLSLIASIGMQRT